MSAIPPGADVETFCHANIRGNLVISNWYYGQIGGLIAAFFGFIVLLLLIDVNAVHFRVRSAYIAVAQFLAWAAVMVALGFNFKARVDNSNLPFCGLELEPRCTALTAESSGMYFLVFSGASFALGSIVTLVTAVLSPKAVAYIAYKELPFACDREYALSLMKWIGVGVIHNAPLLMLVIFSPGMMFLEVVPFDDTCIQDRNVDLLYYFSIAHGCILALCFVAPLPDILLSRRRKRSSFKFTGFMLFAFVASGAAMFFVHFVSSARQGYYVSLIVFTAFFPPLVMVALRLVSAIEAFWVHAFAFHNTTAFAEEKPSWSLSNRIARYESTFANTTLTDALNRLDGGLDRFYQKLDVQDIERRVRAEFNDRNMEPSDTLQETEGRLALMALTTILPPREDKCIDRFVRRVQLYDRLHDVLEAALNHDEDVWISDLEHKLMPLLVLITNGLRRLPEAKQHDKLPASLVVGQDHSTASESNTSHRRDGGHGDGGGDTPASYIHIRRFNRTDIDRNWFLENVAQPSTATPAPAAADSGVAKVPIVAAKGEGDEHPATEDDDEGSDTATAPDLNPVVFRTFLFGFSDKEAAQQRAGKNDGLLVVHHGRKPFNPSPLFSSFGPMRYVRDAVSLSWLEAERGDMLYSPDATYAVIEVSETATPTIIHLAHHCPADATPALPRERGQGNETRADFPSTATRTEAPRESARRESPPTAASPGSSTPPQPPAAAAAAAAAMATASEPGSVNERGIQDIATDDADADAQGREAAAATAPPADEVPARAASSGYADDQPPVRDDAEGETVGL